jgi:hypothetical protein
MKLIALAIFLLSISTNAFAKVEIWRCDNNAGHDLIYKLDTKIPMVYYRDRGEWEISEKESYSLEYKDDSILVRTSSNKLIRVFDMFLKEILAIDTRTDRAVENLSVK